MCHSCLFPRRVFLRKPVGAYEPTFSWVCVANQTNDRLASSSVPVFSYLTCVQRADGSMMHMNGKGLADPRSIWTLHTDTLSIWTHAYLHEACQLHWRPARSPSGARCSTLESVSEFFPCAAPFTEMRWQTMSVQSEAARSEARSTKLRWVKWFCTPSHRWNDCSLSRGPAWLNCVSLMVRTEKQVFTGPLRFGSTLNLCKDIGKPGRCDRPMVGRETWVFMHGYGLT